MQIEIVSLFVLLAVVLVTALLPFIVLGYAEKKTREFKARFERGDIPLDPTVVPPIVGFYGSLLRSRKKYAAAFLASFSYALLVLNVSAFVLFGSVVSLTLGNLILIVVGFIAVIMKEPDSTGGLGKSWYEGLKRIDRMHTA